MTSAPTRLSVLLLCAVFTLCLYRAATQALTIDEAFTFLRYVDTPWRDVFGDFSANNHVLFSLFSRIFRYKFGRSEIVLRIPTLIGCILYLLASFRICRQVVGERWLLPVALALLTLNPLVLDFMVAARGYGLALGLFWWALYLLWREKMWGAGVLAGLSIAANMIFLVPVAALGVVAIPMYARRQKFWDLLNQYAIPAIVIPFTILVIPVSKGAGQFYYGAATLQDTVASLVNESISKAPDYVSRQVVPIVFLLAMAIGAWLVLKVVGGGSHQLTLLAFVLGCMGLSVVFWVAMHRVAGMPYPLNRTGLYMLPLTGLAIVIAAAISPWKSVSLPMTALASLIAVLYLTELRTGYFKEWRDEAGMHRLVRRLQTDAAELAKTREVTAGGTWILEYSMRYYGKRYRLPWLKVLDTGERESIRPDYYILTQGETNKVEELRLKVVERDALSGTLLARSY